ncbi:MAG: RNA polymerase sigma factor [Clostridiales bacterium]|nr:RNA polymerase sigma factor [Clostridiales bacterium]
MNESPINDEFIQNVIDRYSDTIFRVSFQYVGNTLDAEDIVQDVFFALLEYACLAEFESDEHMKAWLIRVAINKSKNAAKRNARRKSKELAGFMAPSEVTEDRFDDLEFVLSGISPLDREIVYLHYYEGYSAKEIAEIVHKTEKSVFKRLSRARSKLKDFLSEGGR